jgi:hypothetical protein
MTDVQTFFAIVGVLTVTAVGLLAFVGAVAFGVQTVRNWL